MQLRLIYSEYYREAPVPNGLTFSGLPQSAPVREFHKNLQSLLPTTTFSLDNLTISPASNNISANIAAFLATNKWNTINVIFSPEDRSAPVLSAALNQAHLVAENLQLKEDIEQKYIPLLRKASLQESLHKNLIVRDAVKAGAVVSLEHRDRLENKIEALEKKLDSLDGEFTKYKADSASEFTKYKADSASDLQEKVNQAVQASVVSSVRKERLAFRASQAYTNLVSNARWLIIQSVAQASPTFASGGQDWESLMKLPDQDVLFKAALKDIGLAEEVWFEGVDFAHDYNILKHNTITKKGFESHQQALVDSDFDHLLPGFNALGKLYFA